jgi:O-acetyl-ADP-ribose deacetylase (regulator of RNase III)
MITETTKSIFESDAKIKINTVNCVGVMGKGLALEFKKHFPDMFKDYKEACDKGEVQPGKLHIYVDCDNLTIINFPTKKHWSDKSCLYDIELGLKSLVEYLKPLGRIKVSIPALGCRNGGLEWNNVKSLIYEHLNGLDAEILLHTPDSYKER